MLITDLKDSILNKKVQEKLYIFKYDDTDFVPMQYAKEIGKICGATLSFIDSLDEIVPTWGIVDDKVLYIYKCDSITEISKKASNLIIITKSVGKDVVSSFSESIVVFPKLEDWMLEDFVISYCDGITSEDAKWLVSRYSNPYKIANELDKVKIFPTEMHNHQFNLFAENGVFSPIEGEHLLELSSALQKKDFTTVCKIINTDNYEMGIDPLPLLFMLQTAFKKLLKVWLNKNPTPDNTGLKSNQIWAINKLPKVFSRDGLLHIFGMVSMLDSKIKSGEMPMNMLADYLIIKILSTE